MAEYPKQLHDVKYGDEHKLQTLDICLPRPLNNGSLQVDASTDDSVWIVFLHGGAWRDDSQDKAELKPALSQLLDHFSRDAPTSALRHVVGLASINYRLSGEPSDPARNGTHPDHVHDVLLALQWLEKEYGVGSKWPYMAVGHSCGATLAFQIVMDRQWKSAIPSKPALYEKLLGFAGAQDNHKQTIRPPVAVVGLEGVYDFPLLLKNYAHDPEYEGFIRDAFGGNHDVWQKASPVAGDYSDRWPDGHLVVLGQSPEDELVDWPQVDSMVKVLKEQGWKMRSESRIKEARRDSWIGGKQFFVTYLKGSHDEVWEHGTELSRTIEFSLRVFYGEE
ncbi:alpha/beta-hydrolase [Rhizodiscina lignyota]|uniref:Kynurenine formamidase n=1 Tax=Rhizodiscina lignyota TaxID=1504668 RepID=A0A9P4I8T9_9PEZI|nr:alpha/beta-hydrolase [Rhizodiscina lignyota]